MVRHHAWVQLEKVELGDCGVTQVVAEACNIDLTRPVQVKEAGKLVIECIANGDATSILELNFQIFNSDFRVV